MSDKSNSGKYGPSGVACITVLVRMLTRLFSKLRRNTHGQRVGVSSTFAPGSALLRLSVCARKHSRRPLFFARAVGGRVTDPCWVARERHFNSGPITSYPDDALAARAALRPGTPHPSIDDAGTERNDLIANWLSPPNSFGFRGQGAANPRFQTSVCFAADRPRVLSEHRGEQEPCQIGWPLGSMMFGS